ncbi:Dystrophin [Hypsibius exemplaris]|uniref:Dystrophin n=1 Tax=Hypsibius exemplaris TaxID=2072580 RepID=A0A1W0WVT4_HYPEX|nr:Dystrophin [Hypsibius exemplaris]
MSGRDGKRRQRAREESAKVAKIDPASTTDSADDVVKDIIKGRTGEQERIQQKVFARWINSRFAKVNNPRRIEDLFQDLRTGVNLAALVELITGSKVVVEKGKTRLHFVCNITKALEVLEQHEIKLVNISADDIEDGNSKLTLSLTWAIIQHYYVKRLGGTVSDLRINNLDKTLLCWCQLACKGYPHVDVKNLHTSWTDGLAFNALIHKYRDELFDYSALLNNTAEVNLAHAFTVAADHLDVPRLLEPEDVLQGAPDQKSIVTYLLCLLEALPHEAMEVKALAAVSELDYPATGENADTDANYQTSAETVLVWMLSVEEKLDRGEISDTLEQANVLWQEHEKLLMDLSVQENTVRHVLEHGAKILQKSRPKSKQANDVENLMTVLAEKWESLQVKSAERSKLLRKILTILQQEHVRTINGWLLETEKRIALLKVNTNSIETMDAQLRELSKLQDDLEKQLKVMNELMHLLFVGENGDDEEVESELFGFRRRWDDICHWTESQWTFVRRIRDTYDDFLKLCNECSDWINGRIELLQGLPTGQNDRLDWIQNNLDLLREMHDQMMDYQEKIQLLQEKSDALLEYFAAQTAVGMQVRRREEKICAEWNELVDMLEVWTTDTSVHGHFEKSDALRSSKFRHSKRYSDNGEAGSSTALSPSTSGDHQHLTKRIRQAVADEGLLENCEVLVDWLRQQHRALGVDSGQSNLSPVADKPLMAQISQELSGKDAEYKSLRMLAEDIILEKRTAGQSFEEIENKLNELASLWNKLTWTLGAGSTSPMLGQDEEDYTHNMEVLEDVLISCQKTVERFDHDKEPSPAQLEQDLDDCKDRVHLMKINAGRITETAALVNKITGQALNTSDIEVPWLELCQRWKQTQTRLTELETSFTAMKENRPTRAFLLEIEALKVWTSHLHKQLMDEQALHVTYLDKMTEQLLHYQNIQHAVAERQPSLERANSPPKQLVEKLIGTNYQKELIDLNAEWRDIRQYLQHNSDDLNKWCEDLRSFEIDTDNLKQWMVDVDTFLNIDIDSVEDPVAFAALEDQFRGLEDDIKALAPTTEQLLVAGRAFLRTTEEGFASSVKETLKEIEEQFSSICTRAARQLQNLTIVAAQRRESQGGLVATDSVEIQRIRSAIPLVTNIASVEALENAKTALRKAKDLVRESRQGKGDSRQVEALRNLDGDISSKEVFLSNYSAKWATLSDCVLSCHAWMDEVETLLEQLGKADDGRTGRQLLNKLNDFMSTQDSDKYATIAELAEEFEQNRILVPLVKSEVDKMRTRLGRLSKRVSEQQSQTASRSDSRTSDTSDATSTGAASGGGASSFLDNLSNVTALLSDLQTKLPLVELKTFDSVVIKGQLEECVLLYKKLSEIKGEVETLIKQGREQVEADPARPDNEGLSRRLDTMKAQYNQMGAQVTATKADLDNGLKLVKKAEKEVETLRLVMDELDGALAELDKLADMDEYDDIVKDAKMTARQKEETVNNLRSSHQQLRELAMKSNVPGFELKYTGQMQRWNKMQARLRTLQSPNKENIPQAAMVAGGLDLTSRHGLAAARHEFFRQQAVQQLQSPSSQPAGGTVVSRHHHVAEIAPASVVTTTTSRETTTIITHTTAQQDTSAVAGGSKAVSLYQLALRQEIEASREVTTRNKPEGGLVQPDRSDSRVESLRRLEAMLTKFDGECTRIEDTAHALTEMAPSAGDVEQRTRDFEALKHDASLNEALQKDILREIDAVDRETSVVLGAGVRNDITDRWSGIRQRLEDAEQNTNAVQAFYKLLKEDFLVWLPKAESVAASLQEERAAESDPRFKRLVEERDSRISSYDAIVHSGRTILATVYKNADGSALESHLDAVSERWTDLSKRITAIRNTSRAAHQQHTGSGGFGSCEDIESYLASLDESVKWVSRKKEELTTMHPSGDRVILQKFHNYHNLFRGKMEGEQARIEGLIMRGRELASSPSLSLEYRKTHNFDMADLNEKVRMLSESWQSLFRESDALQLRTETVTAELDSLLKLCEAARVKTEDLRTESNKWEDTDEVPVDDLSKKVDDAKKFKSKVEAQATRLEEVNALAARLQRTPSGLSEEVVRSVAYLNEQKEAFAHRVDDRLAQLHAASGHVTSSDNQHFLATSVDEPWERRVGPNKVPYYINHAEEVTQWDHPRLTDIMSSLLEVNKIRFSAYRTATKLRFMQKKLHLDLLQLNAATEIFDKCGLRAQNDNTLDCTQAVACLMVIYEHLNTLHPNRINFALAIDVCLNWLLNCHDPDRTGQLRVLAFKVSIVVLCQGELNAKYRYLFRLITDENGRVDQAHVGQLLYCCLQIPRYLGEVAAFGGTDVNPSVLSCFKFSTNGIDIQLKQFLAWLAREPQALAWFSVLHRQIAAEPSRHHAKCNVCECFPINGLRYRCLKCFNYDLCQNCFFTGLRTKSHKLSHPMQEYSYPATSSEDMRDFKRVLKNKLRPRDSFRNNSNLGYLPVESGSGRGVDHDKSATLTSLNSNAKGSVGSSDPADFTQTRIIEFEGSRGASSPEADDEHSLITRYASTLNGVSDSTQSTVQVLQAVEQEEQAEMERYVQELQSDHDRLIRELETMKHHQDLKDQEDVFDISSEDMLVEATMLRDDKTRLEERMKILEEHNHQLDSQLQRIKVLLETPDRGSSSPQAAQSHGSPLKYSESVNESLRPEKPPRSPSSLSPSPSRAAHRQTSRQHSNPSYSVGQLFHAAGSLNTAVGSLVTVMAEEEKNNNAGGKDQQQHSRTNGSATLS